MIGETTKDELIAQGYHIENAYIKNVRLSMADYSCLSSNLDLIFERGGIGFGGYCLGKGYVGASNFSSNGSGLVYLMRIMDVIGSDTWEGLKGKYCRVAYQDKDRNGPFHIIGNIIDDKFFDVRSFFEEYEKEARYAR